MCVKEHLRSSRSPHESCRAMEELEEAIICVGSKWQLSSAEQWLHPRCPSPPDKVAPGAQIPPGSAGADPVSHCVPHAAVCPRRECASSLPTSASLTTWYGCYVWQKAESHCWVPHNLICIQGRWAEEMSLLNRYIYIFFPREISNESCLFCSCFPFLVCKRWNRSSLQRKPFIRCLRCIKS